MADEIKRYYYCVNCGAHGDFKRPKKRSIHCEKCSYKDIIGLDKEEYNAKMLEVQNFADYAYDTSKYIKLPK